MFASIASIAITSDTSLIKQIASESENLADPLSEFCLLINSKSVPLVCFFEKHKTNIANIVKRKASWFPACNVSILGIYKDI